MARRISTSTFASRGVVVTGSSRPVKAGSVAARTPSPAAPAAVAAVTAARAASVAKAAASPVARGFAAESGAAGTGTLGEAASALEQQYAPALRYLHWLIAGGTIGTFAMVQLAQRVKGKEKMKYMVRGSRWVHTVVSSTARSDGSHATPWMRVYGSLSVGQLKGITICLHVFFSTSR